MKNKFLAVRVSAEIHKALKGEALKQNLTMQQLLTYIMNDYLKSREEIENKKTIVHKGTIK